jgi:LysR family transcriptional regulator, benzoate and cis,cis-muconate-responsive activator of ben and cat genes
VSVDLRQLECFIVVAEESNLSRAAAKLHMTQPPLTRRIQRLEKAVGAALFLRTARGMELTAPGHALLEQARRIMAMAERAVEVTRAAQAGETGQLSVGYFGSTIFRIVPRLLAGFSSAHPGIEIRLDRMPKAEQVDAIRDGRIHIGFSRLYGEVPDLRTLDLAEEPLFLAVPAGHPLGRRRRLRVRDLSGQPLVLFPRERPSFADEVVRLCAGADISPRVHTEAEDAVTALAHVAIGAAVAVVPESATGIALPGVTFVPLVDAPTQYLSCIYRPSDVPPVLDRLLAFLDTWRSEQALSAARTP